LTDDGAQFHAVIVEALAPREEQVGGHQ